MPRRAKVYGPSQAVARAAESELSHDERKVDRLDCQLSDRCVAGLLAVTRLIESLHRLGAKAVVKQADDDEGEQRRYAPMYSTHGHERKTHIAVSGGPSLCGIEKRHNGLLWTQGADYESVERQFLIDNPGRERNGCLRCRAAYLKIEKG